jgi:Leucine Rich repeat
VEALASAFEENRTLTTLNVARNGFGDVGCAALAEALSTQKQDTNCGLQKLYVYENQIGNRGASAVSEIIMANTALQEVYIWDNRIGAPGHADLHHALGHRREHHPTARMHLKIDWKASNAAARHVVARAGGCGDAASFQFLSLKQKSS